ncbi:MAG: PhzF family phenazine biosynthesis protein [Woeseiaceae bacterium]
MKHHFYTCDVFTKTRFGGNQLAVLPDATGLSTEEMQQIAREFNYSESTFVSPSENDCTRKVRIFTPSIEVPFAGHPNVGTAFVLAATGALGDIGDGVAVTFDEAAGVVPITIKPGDGGQLCCELRAPEVLTLGDPLDPEIVANALSLEVGDIATSTHLPQAASVGLPFLMVELGSVEALRRARCNSDVLEKLHDDGIVADVHMYVHSNDEFDIRARMFAPLDGVPEDPATGSANCALAALLTRYAKDGETEYSWRIAQGVEMGRPSVLEARTRREDDEIAVWIGGYSVLVSEGHLYHD